VVQKEYTCAGSSFWKPSKSETVSIQHSSKPHIAQSEKQARLVNVIQFVCAENSFLAVKTQWSRSAQQHVVANQEGCKEERQSEITFH
jgi:hypothetical protein